MNTMFTLPFKASSQPSMSSAIMTPSRSASNAVNFSAKQQPNVMLFVLKAIISLIQNLESQKSTSLTTANTSPMSIGKITAPPSIMVAPANVDSMEKQQPVDPFPPLLKIVKENGTALNITPTQKAEIENFKQQPDHMPLCKRLAKEIRADEKLIRQGFVTGMPDQQIKLLMDKTLQARKQISEVRLQCRVMLQKVLTPEQFQQVVKIAMNMS